MSAFDCACLLTISHLAGRRRRGPWHGGKRGAAVSDAGARRVPVGRLGQQPPGHRAPLGRHPLWRDERMRVHHRYWRHHRHRSAHFHGLLCAILCWFYQRLIWNACRLPCTLSSPHINGSDDSWTRARPQACCWMRRTRGARCLAWRPACTLSATSALPLTAPPSSSSTERERDLVRREGARLLGLACYGA